MHSLALGVIACLLASFAYAQSTAAPQPTYGAMLEGFDYPYPVKSFELDSQKQHLPMAYMDVAGRQSNGRTIVLLHGKNFCAATWEATTAVLVEQGWRVIAPDQIGFCKSSKPAGYQFTLHQLAANTRALLDSLQIRKAVIMGHSMGGMLAARFAISFPQSTEGLLLVNPIGLEDWEAAGIPYQTLDQWLTNETRTNADSIRNYQRSTYYANRWDPRYDRWVTMLAGMYAGPGREQVMWNQAQTSDMIFTQPIVYQLPRIRAPTVLFIGEQDTTAIGKAAAPPDVQARVGRYAELGPRIAKIIPNARLVRFPELGHAPQIQDPERFHGALIQALQQLDSKAQ